MTTSPLGKLHEGSPYRLGIDPDLVAFQLERLAKEVRAGDVCVRMVSQENIGTADDWQGEKLSVQFNRKDSAS